MINIRALKEDDFEQWLALYHHYADHYQVALNDEIIATSWGWLIDENHPLCAIAAENDEGELIGLAHYRAMPSPLRGAYIGFLDDLIVAPKARGGDVADLLLQNLKSIGAAQGWAIIRWITRDNNYRARSLYDKFATKTDWNMYEMKLS